MPASKPVSKVIKAALIAALVVAALVWGVWLVAVPISLINNQIDGQLAGQGVRAEFDGFRKGLFFSVKADAARLLSAKGDTGLLYLEDIRVALNVASVFRFNPEIEFSAVVSGGDIAGTAGLDGTVHLEARGVELSGLGLENLLTGLRAGGRADMTFKMQGGRGEAKFAVEEMRFAPYKYLAFTLPLELFSKARGLVLIEGGLVTVESVTFEGDGIFARARGNLGKGSMDLTLELMPSRQLEASQFYFSMLRRFQVTPGHYSIPIKTSY